jgi:hypothetical protein
MSPWQKQIAASSAGAPDFLPISVSRAKEAAAHAAYRFNALAPLLLLASLRLAVARALSGCLVPPCFLLLGLRAAWRFNCLACRETWPARPSRDRGSKREVHALQ